MLLRIVSCVLMACCMFANVSLGFQTPFMPRSLARLKDAGWHARYDTSLQMGLRSFLKTKVLGRKEDMGEKVRAEKLPKKETKVTVASEEKAAATTINVTGPVTDASVAKTKAKPVEKESRKEEKLPPLRTESIKDRLNRVRSGKMTEDEKQAFLRTALSAKDTATSRKPLRQRLPDETVEGNRPASGNNATPFPTLLKNVASTWGKNDTRASEVPLRSWRDGAKMKDQQKKRDYFAMVTDPNRFHTYKSSKVTAPGNATEYDVVHDGVIRPQIDMEEEETTAVEQLGMEEQETIVVGDDDDESKEYEHMGQAAGDLGTRLETAAIALEEAAKAREQERLETEKRLEKQRLEQKQRLEELRIKQQLEMEKRELELKAKKREEEEVMAREIEKRRREEEARRRELMEAQDTYWAKKLQAEREARMQGMSQKQKEEFVKQEALETKKAMEVAQQESTTPIATNEFAPKFKKVNSSHCRIYLEAVAWSSWFLQYSFCFFCFSLMLKSDQKLFSEFKRRCWTRFRRNKPGNERTCSELRMNRLQDSRHLALLYHHNRRALPRQYRPRVCLILPCVVPVSCRS